MDIKKIILTLIIISMFVVGGCFYVGEGGSYSDTDFDGVVDLDDVCNGFDDTLDDDADGVPDGCDQCPGFDDNEDLDGDGVIDGCATQPAGNDADGDGVDDSLDVCPGYDDNIDTDADTLPDDCDTCPLDADNDIDADGVCGDEDICPTVYNPAQDVTDADGNTIPDECELIADADGDGIEDSLDLCPNNYDETNADTDGDDIGDICDTCPTDLDNDADADGVCTDGDLNGVEGDFPCPNLQTTDCDDNCPYEYNGGLYSQQDLDNDGVGEGCDNCPNNANTDQVDGDADGMGDACDPITMAWTLEEVASVGSSMHASSIAASASDDVHISYYDDAVDYLKYAYYDGTSWTFEDIDTTQYAGLESSIALDSSNYPHITYYLQATGELGYAYSDVGTWKISNPIDALATGQGKSSNLIDENDVMHVVYSSGGNMLTHAEGSPGAFFAQIIDSTSMSGQSNALTYYEPDASLKVAYRISGDGVSFVELDQGSWTTPVSLKTGTVVGEAPAIAVDSSGYPHVVYVDYTNYYPDRALEYTYFDGSSWTTPVFKAYVSPSIQQSNIEIDSSGNIYIVYVGDDGYPELVYYSTVSGSWGSYTNIVDPLLVEDCVYLSMDLDSSEKPHMSFECKDLATSTYKLYYLKGE